jgi:polynucleotide 5'-hydroxyl-kinase GRC3/NOL9
MSNNWAAKTADELLSKGLIQTGVCLILGAADTGKTSLLAELAKKISPDKSLAIVDADIGQSHIGPPTTVGWVVFDKRQTDLSQTEADGISFVGDITPTGHLLQLTAAITQSVRQASEKTELIVIDTPGFIYGPAAAALWWTVQRILQPKTIITIQTNNELSGIINGLKGIVSEPVMIKSPPQIPVKSPQQRYLYRQNRFAKYFQNCCLYNINLNDMSLQSGSKPLAANSKNRLIALRDGGGRDLAVGLIKSWRQDNGTASVAAPKIVLDKIRCLIIGDIAIEINDK